MLRRLLEGCGLLLLVALLFNRVDVGFMLPILAVLAVVGFTAWRIRNLWHRYQVHRMVQQRPENRNVAVENEMLALRGHQHARSAELTFWTGFMMGGAMMADAPSAHAGDGGDSTMGGAEGGMDIGGGFGGDM